MMTSTSIIAFIILASIGTSAFQIVHLHFVDNQYCMLLIEDHNAAFIYFTTFEMLKLVVPMVILCITYVLSGMKIKQIRRRSCNRKSNNDEILRRRMRQNKQITMMFLTIVLIFFLFNAPYSFFQIFYIFTIQYQPHAWDHHAGTICHYVTFALSTVSCAVNPFIYAKMEKEIRKKVRDFLRKHKQKLCWSKNGEKSNVNLLNVQETKVSNADF